MNNKLIVEVVVKDNEGAYMNKIDSFTTTPEEAVMILTSKYIGGKKDVGYAFERLGMDFEELVKRFGTRRKHTGRK